MHHSSFENQGVPSPVNHSAQGLGNNQAEQSVHAWAMLPCSEVCMGNALNCKAYNRSKAGDFVTTS